jgi:hypothetical protein
MAFTLPKMPCYLENLRKLMGKVKKEGEPDGIVTRGPGIEWCVLLQTIFFTRLSNVIRIMLLTG